MLLVAFMLVLALVVVVAAFAVLVFGPEPDRKRTVALGVLGFLCLAASLMLACVPVPRSIPPQLERWAVQKAARLATCRADGHRGQALLECLGDYSVDRGTYACERAAQSLAP